MSMYGLLNLNFIILYLWNRSTAKVKIQKWPDKAVPNLSDWPDKWSPGPELYGNAITTDP